VTSRRERSNAGRLAREARTIQVMIGMYCGGNHATRAGLCTDCHALQDYALGRLERCPYGGSKPTCANCPIHCYAPEMRERIRAVMRYAGPRMLLHHPLLALGHLVDGTRRKAGLP
jgi:predicted amidophosphoribosyltransferase